jgi:flagellar basal body-associated protein FliL
VREAAMLISIFISIGISILIAMLLPFFMMSNEAEKKARARRLADAKMNARLLRFNL